jgi:hypothetical protein
MSEPPSCAGWDHGRPQVRIAADSRRYARPLEIVGSPRRLASPSSISRVTAQCGFRVEVLSVAGPKSPDSVPRLLEQFYSGCSADELSLPKAKQSKGLHAKILGDNMLGKQQA